MLIAEFSDGHISLAINPSESIHQLLPLAPHGGLDSLAYVAGFHAGPSETDAMLLVCHYDPAPKPPTYSAAAFVCFSRCNICRRVIRYGMLCGCSVSGSKRIFSILSASLTNWLTVLPPRPRHATGAELLVCSGSV